MISKILQFLWGATGLIALGAGIYNITIGTATGVRKFIPFLVFAFCLLVFLNLRRQIKFKKTQQQNSEN